MLFLHGRASRLEVILLIHDVAWCEALTADFNIPYALGVLLMIARACVSCFLVLRSR